MRKLLSVVFLLVLTFNWVGYDLFMSWYNSRINQQAQSLIDKKRYDNDQLIVIEIDLPIPYATDWEQPESVTGIISYNGNVLNFVERKYEQGKMIYKCLPNSRGTAIQNARDYFYSLVYEMDRHDQQPDKAPAKLVAKKPVSETLYDEYQCVFSDLSLINAKIKFSCTHPLLDGVSFIPVEPPEA